MHIIKVMSIIVVLVALIINFSACKSTSEPSEPEQTQLTQEQAEAFYQQNAYIIAAMTSFLVDDMVASTTGNIENLGYFGTYGFGKSAAHNKDGRQPMTRLSDSDTIYYRGDGCWVLDYEEASEYLDADVSGEVCFGTYNAAGYPLQTNNVMDHMLQGTISSSYIEEGYSNLSSFNMMRDFNVTGISNFYDQMGPLTINGSQTEEISASFTSNEGSYNSKLKVIITVEDFKVDNQMDYPAGGTYSFQIDLDSAETGGQPVKYLINGSVTFDGSSIAAVVFNGYNFDFDMDNYYY